MIQRNEDVLFCSLHFTGKLQVILFPVTKRGQFQSHSFGTKNSHRKFLLVVVTAEYDLCGVALLMPKKSLPLCDGSSGHINTLARHSLQFSQKYSPISSERDVFPDLALR